MRREISRRATGTKDSMRNISQASLRDIKIRVPPIDEQRRIVATIDSQTASLNHAKELSNLAFRKARSLRRSLLAEAFVGRLVDQNPSDENASELLQRTRAEHGAPDFIRRTRRGKGEVKTQKEALL
jgi:type I restriction enzyme, S subunit